MQQSTQQGAQFGVDVKDRIRDPKDYKDIVAWVDDLPPLPIVASQALVLVENPNASALQLSNLLGKDPALAARVLKIANSAMFCFQREITTLNQAIMLIGFKSLRGIIVAATLRQISRRTSKLEQAIWQNSTCAALGASVISKKLQRQYGDEAFLYGLLHDIGKSVMMRHLPEVYASIIKESQKGRQCFEVESETLGYTHALVGALVAKKWNFPGDACQVILHHHDPLGVPFENETYEITAVVQLANLYAHKLGYGHFEGCTDPTPEAYRCAKDLGLDQAASDALCQEIGEMFTSQGSVFS